jgi:hypothetical protein
MVDLPVRPGTTADVFVVAPRLVVPEAVIGNGDLRRLGVGVLTVGVPAPV